MPLVSHHQPTPGQNNVSPELLPNHPRVIYSLLFTALGFVFIFTLRSVIGRRKRYIRRPGTLPTSLVSAALDQQRLWLSEKSRGVSSNSIAMSANHPPERPPLKTDFQAQLAHDATSEDGSKVDSDGTKEDCVAVSSPWHAREYGRGEAIYRPPPPPPLTPLTPATLTRGNFPFENRRLSGAVSVVGDLDPSFFDQPNPDYMSSSDNSSSTALDTTQTTTPAATPRRKSYTKVLPINSPRVITDRGEIPDQYAPPPPLSFSPSSFPSSPILPLAPHVSFEQHQQQPPKQEIDVKGEIISLTDDSGASWKRHTRVYGGGVCMACMASGGDNQHGGGFYGENVRPEDRR